MHIHRQRGTNPYFKNYKSTNEQDLFEDLAIESIKVWGIDVYYIPRVIDEIDDIFREDDMSEYNHAIPIEMYIKNTMGFGGDSIFMKDFGYEMRQELVMVVAKRTFDQEVGAVTGAIRPNEGDLIYFPLEKKCFRIRFTDHHAQFYQLGKLRVYDLICDTFEFSNQRVNTGVPEIDRLNVFQSTMEQLSIETEEGNDIMTQDNEFILPVEFGEDNSELDWDRQNEEYIKTEANTSPSDDDNVIDWSETDPFSRKGRY